MKNYQELKENALSSTSTNEDRLELFLWMEQNADRKWNGECFDVDGNRLFPVYEIVYDDNGDIDTIELIGAEFR